MHSFELERYAGDVMLPELQKAGLPGISDNLLAFVGDLVPITCLRNGSEDYFGGLRDFWVYQFLSMYLEPDGSYNSSTH
ncbi:hypothetical protein CVT26_004958 [Gymnopilus dilepis]|uniref:Uncharacterized protein n=1 Tax=Gymnopilus dilepis TaxID=231916 RepID=A0A409Y005_9AGAR|nr:hypothetical protein CVT26_004958 [Gymnopilus dilepis]